MSSEKIAKVKEHIAALRDHYARVATHSPATAHLPEIAENELPLVERVAAARLPEGTPAIALCFIEPRDRALHAAVLETAARLRRTPEQQILWILQNSLEQEAGLLAEASASPRE